MGEEKCSKTIQVKCKGKVFNERNEEQVFQESHWIPSLRGLQEELDICDPAPVKGRGMQQHGAETERKKIQLQVSWDSCDEDISEASLSVGALAMCRFPSMDKTWFNSSHRHLVLPQPSGLKVTFCWKGAGREEEGVEQILWGFPLSPVLGVQVAGPAIALGAQPN